MTSDVDVFKTNEFLRRRKLRLQQVREQSKDIAKKIRQRAKVEKLRHAKDLDGKKEKEYLECQDKLVKRLELLYSKGLQNVGASHRSALEVSQSDIVEKTDLSKLRGKEAAAELRKRKQEKLDEQRKILERKVQAREAANELSREKSSTTAKNLTKQIKKPDNSANKPVCDTDEAIVKEINKDDKNDNPNVTKADMGTQWEFTELLNEWEPNVPTLSLPKDDTTKDVENSDKTKRLNLFALSDEMPSSLRGGLSSVVEETVPLKSTLNLVSEYLQNRKLRLREFEPVKRQTDDLQSIRQTILRTRVSRADGSVSDICHVLDKQVIPVPSWQAECNFDINNHRNKSSHNSCKCLSRMQVHSLHASLLSPKHCLHSNQTSKSPSRNTKFIHGAKPVLGKDKSGRSTDPDITLTRKKSISIYNHNTRDVRDIPCGNERFVINEKKSNDDAYAQALQETASASNMEREKINKRQQDMRNKVALTRQTVDKEYRDTLAFLNSLPKDKGEKPIKSTYMDDKQQQLQKDRRQRKMQQEFKKIERECQKQNCTHNRRKTTVLDSRSKSKSPVINEEQHRENFEYSWMPVPESDNNLAVHTIPTTTKTKSGNTVKFSEPNGYHEYRSRHKHTPPTKDNDDRHSKRVVETVILEQNSNGSDENNSSSLSETSSVENLSLDRDKVQRMDSEQQDAERIIIYKILDSRKKKSKKSKKSEGIKRKTSENNPEMNYYDNKMLNNEKQTSNIEQPNNNIQKSISFDQLQEGIYKGVSKDGDNVTSMYYTNENIIEEVGNPSKQSDNNYKSCCCRNSKICDKDIDNEEDKSLRKTNTKCHCGKKENKDNLVQPSAATSTTSFKTAPNDKTNYVNPDSGFIKLIDDGAQETGKFYIGASGFIKDDNYEVVIQLRKKDGEKQKVQENKDLTTSVSEKPSALKLKEVIQNVTDEKDFGHSKNMKEIPIDRTSPNRVMDAESNKILEDTKQDRVLNVDRQSLHNEPLEKKIVEPQQKTDMCEKAVHTSFEDTYPIPVSVPKSDPLPRPATSTYTQTSFNSSIQRPAFMHMSSSTSTAYMSPPELVLPKFLKQDYMLTHDELFESENTANKSDQQYEVIESNCGDYEECRCKWCVCGVNGMVKNVNGFKINSKNGITSNTPPNTERSYSNDFANKVNYTKRACKHHKGRPNSQIKLCRKSHRKRSNSENNRSLKSYISENYENLDQSKRTKIPGAASRYKADGKKINPVVKNYVNKLLALNREGLKAVEVIKQDCSNVSTPHSSIINVPSNNNRKPSTEVLQNKISLEQIKDILKQQIVQENFDQFRKNIKASNVKHTESQTEKVPKLSLRLSKKKSVHKVKSLNISRQVLIKKKLDARFPPCSPKMTTSASSSTRENRKVVNTKNSRSKSSPTPRRFENSEYKNGTSSDVAETNTSKRFKNVIKNWQKQTNNTYPMPESNSLNTKSLQTKDVKLRSHRLKQTYVSSDSEVSSIAVKRIATTQSPTNISTQTNGSIDVEANFMKIAEDKLQNMEKIADLTEKCTKRLSNLAKVLEEVRKNKSLVYSQISTSESASDSENKSHKNEATHMPVTSHSNIVTQNIEAQQPHSSLSIPAILDEMKLCARDSVEYTPFLKDIPKPESFVASNEKSVNDKTTKTSNTASEHVVIKPRGKPPPALSRINLKNGQEINVTPHELSTVIEVDSPMSLKRKNNSSRYDNKFPNTFNQISDETANNQEKNVITSSTELKESRIDPDLLQSNVTIPRQSKILSTDSSDESKIHSIDLKKFNNIMLKPFISLQDYAKQCNVGLDEGSNLEDAMKDDPVNDDLSSLHSDGSLPDVIAELLKRKMISEPFKFDSASNVNSTTLSSESTVSLLALSKTRKSKKKSGILIKNKQSIVDTSESLSISSNPDLENAFQKLGMGWASSTLKKTKERLALSSSSNTSSSSMTQFKIKSFSQDVPTLVTDSTSSMVELSHMRDKKKLSPSRNSKENSKNAIQQTSLTNSMTVKEFLTNELAKKITFSNKSTRKEADDDFVSLYETQMPEEMKHTNPGKQEDGDRSVASANNNRARTSTPVQIFKSTTYNSTSSSNTSNGLFSNADDLSSVKVTSTSIRNHSTSDKDDLTIPNYTLKTRKELSDSKSE